MTEPNSNMPNCSSESDEILKRANLEHIKRMYHRYGQYMEKGPQSDRVVNGHERLRREVKHAAIIHAASQRDS